MTTEERLWAVAAIVIAAVGTYFAYEQTTVSAPPSEAPGEEASQPTPLPPPIAPPADSAGRR